MNFKPQDFFIGLIDFFSILMPGAFLSYLAKDRVSEWAGHGGSFPLDSAENGLIFLFSAYLLGHFIFLLGSGLDLLLYDPIRSWTDRGQIKRLSRGHGLSAKWKRDAAKAKLIFGENPDAALMRAEISKALSLLPISSEKTINAFQWSKARLAKEHPEGLATVQRFEADSKFFRSFVIVLIPVIAALIARPREKWELLSLSAAMLALALWRYVEQRFKSTQNAYWQMIMLDAVDAKPAAAAPLPVPAAPTHAGGVVYRIGNGKAEYLLIAGGPDGRERVLPKGHIEPGENPRETCVREVREESGHWAGVSAWIGDFDLPVGSGSMRVRFYLMKLAEEGGKRPPEVREQAWMPLQDALEKARFPETRKILEMADQIRSALPS